MVTFLDEATGWGGIIVVDHLTAKLGLTRSAADVARQFPEGKSVDVFHHPDKPETAVLETGIKGETLAPVCFGFLFFIVGGIVIRRGFRDHKRAESGRRE